MFGSNFGNNPSTFGGGGFSTTTPSTSVFGQQQLQQQLQQPTGTTSLFGGFSQPKTNTFGSSFGAPQQQTNTMFGQNRLAAPTTGGLFGSQTATVSPFSSAVAGQTQVPMGTSVTFIPITGSDTMMKNGQSAQISTRHQCITCMKEYENKSLEELRMEDYQLNRKGPQTSSMFGAAQPQPASTGLFSNMGATNTSTPFGQPSTFGAATSTASGGMFSTFNQPKPASSNFFSTPATSSTFGTTNAFSFSSPATQPTSVFGASANPVAQGGLGQTSAFGFGQPQQQTGGGLFGAKPLTAAPTTGFSGFGAFTNTSTANKPTTLGFGTGFGTSSAAPTFGSAPTSTFGTGTGNMFGSNTSQTLNKPFSFATPFSSQPQATQPTFGSFGTSTGSAFSFNNPVTTTTSSLGFGGTTSTLGGFGGATSAFSAPLFGATQPSTGAFNFGLGSNSSTGFTGFTPTATFSQPQQQQQPAAAPGTAFATTPYKDSPLFYNLIANRDLESMIKPTSPSAQRAVKEASRRRTSTSLSFPTVAPVQKNATFPSARSSTKAIFDGFEDDDDKGYNFDILSPKTSVKKLTLKSLKNSVAPPHRHSISFSGVNRSTPCFENGLNDSVISVPEFNFGSSARDGPLLGSPINTPTKGGEDVVKTTVERERVVGETPPSQLINQKRISDAEVVAPSLLNDRTDLQGCRVTNTRTGYYIDPPMEVLNKMVDEAGNCIVKGLKIGRQNHGEIRYIDPVNIAGINIDEIVHFRHKEVVVYPDDTDKPPVGGGLNCPALVTLERVWPIEKVTKDPIRSAAQLQNMGYEDCLRRACSRLGAEFVSYVAENGAWTFKVPHFSKYAMDEDGESGSKKSSFVASIVRREEVPAATPDDLFKELSFHTTNGPRYKAMPRVIFGPAGTFFSVSNLRFKSPRLNMNRITSYKEQIDRPGYVQILGDQLKTQASWNDLLVKDQLDVLQNHLDQGVEEEFLKHEFMLWELFEILWPSTPDNDPYPALQTHQDISKWLSKYSIELFSDSLGKDPETSILGLLKMGRREEACKLAVKTRNPIIALLISQTPLGKVTYSNCEELLQVWRDENAFPMLSDEIKAIYILTAGILSFDDIDLSKVTTSQWLQLFAIYVWYCCPLEVSVKQAVTGFQHLLRNQLMEHGGWSEEDVSLISFPTICFPSVPNLCVQLLKLYSFDGYPLKSVLDPDAYSIDCLDYKLSWFLMVNLMWRNQTVSESEFSHVASSFAYQLEQVGLFEWSAFVLDKIRDKSSYHRRMIERNLKQLNRNPMLKQILQHSNDILENARLTMPTSALE